MGCLIIPVAYNVSFDMESDEIESKKSVDTKFVATIILEKKPKKTLMKHKMEYILFYKRQTIKGHTDNIANMIIDK